MQAKCQRGPAGFTRPRALALQPLNDALAEPLGGRWKTLGQTGAGSAKKTPLVATRTPRNPLSFGANRSNARFGAC